MHWPFPIIFTWVIGKVVEVKDDCLESVDDSSKKQFAITLVFDAGADFSYDVNGPAERLSLTAADKTQRQEDCRQFAYSTVQGLARQHLHRDCIATKIQLTGNILRQPLTR